jgi:hypothetical protein
MRPAITSASPSAPRKGTVVAVAVPVVVVVVVLVTVGGAGVQARIAVAIAIVVDAVVVFEGEALLALAQFDVDLVDEGIDLPF